MILDTFYLLFKSNAEDVAKGTQKAGKAADDLEKKTKQTDKSTQELGKSFTDIIDKLGTLVTAYISLDALKGGLSHAQQFTAGLQTQSKWLQVNAQDLAVWGSAAATVGGTAEGLQSSIKSLHDQYVKAGVPLPKDPFQSLINLAKAWDAAGLSQTQREQSGLRIGLDEYTILLLLKGGDALEGLLDKRKKLLNLTDEDTRVAAAHRTEWENTKLAFTGLFNKINDVVLPGLDKLLTFVQRIVVFFQEHPNWAVGFVGALTAIGSILAGGVIIGGLGAIGTAASLITPVFVALAAAIGGVTAAAIALSDSSASPGGLRDDGFFGNWWDWIKTGKWGSSDGALDGQGNPNSKAKRPSAGSSASYSSLGLRNNNPGNLRPGGREASYSTPEAGLSALAANLRRYGRNGWNTIASIISHWAPPNENNTAAYIAAVSQATGYGPNQPLDLNDPGVLQKLSNAIIQHENGSNPYSQSQIQQSIVLGQQTLSTASASPFNTSPAASFADPGDKSISIKTGDIHVNTQATDANGIAAAIGVSLKSNLRSTMSNWDDGILA